MLDLVEKTLKIAEGASKYAEVRYEKSNNNRVIFNNGSLEAVDSTETEGLCIRILHDGALGLAFTNKFDLSSIKKSINQAKKMAVAAKSILEKPIIFSEEKTNQKKYEVKQKIKLQDLSVEDRVSQLKNIDKALSKTKLKLPTRYL